MGTFSGGIENPENYSEMAKNIYRIGEKEGWSTQ